MDPEENQYVPKNQAAFIGLISLTIMLATFSMALYVPAMPEMVLDLNSTPKQLQLTLSAFMFGLGASQLVWGPLTDRYGRKPVLIVGLILYVVASLGAWVSPTIEILILFRVLQSFGCCAVPVVCLALVRDVYARDQMARVMAYINAVRAIAPVIAPSLGAVIALGFGWRGNFAFMWIFGIAILVVIWFSLRETHPPSRRHPAPMNKVVANYKLLFGDRRHLGYALGAGFAFASFFVFVSASSFILIDMLQITTLAYALTYAFVASGFGVGSYISARIVNNLGLDKTIAIGMFISICGGALLALLSVAVDLSVFSIAVPMSIVALGVGLVFSNCQTGAIADYPQMAGAAASTSGFIIMMATGGASAIAMQFYTNSEMPLIIGVVAGIGLMAASYYVLVWRGDAAEDSAQR